MKLVGREWSEYRRRFWKMPLYCWCFLKCFFLFRKPLEFISCYMHRSRPASGIVTMRNGLRFHLSNHPHDVVTIFVVFVRKDYGVVKQNSVVLDMGANIGIFSLYAATCGAKRVIALEPSREAAAVLAENVADNNLSSVIEIRRLAVNDGKELQVSFPVESSVYNKIATSGNTAACDIVPTTTLSSLVNEVGPVDLLKIDIEGGEYAVFQPGTSDASTYPQVGEIRMEYHQGRVNELVQFLGRWGLRLSHHQEDSDLLGEMWFTRQ